VVFPDKHLGELPGACHATGAPAQNILGDNSLQHRKHPDAPNSLDSLDCLLDTDGRPQYPLHVILRCAILGAPRNRLTIRDIYAAMENKFSYYRTAGQSWKVRFHSSGFFLY